MSPGKGNFELKVGVFVVIALVVLTVMIFKIENFKFFRPGYAIHVIFNYVSGIDVGASVSLSGVEIGEIKKMEIIYNEKLKKTQVDIGVWIRGKTILRKNSVAKIKSLGMLGQKCLDFTPGSRDNPALKEGDTLFGEDPFSIEDAAESINKVAKNLTKTIDSINAVIGKPDVQESLTETVKNFKETSERANSILTKIDDGKGTIGKLINEDKIYRDTEALVEDIKKHPWKLFFKTKDKKEDSAEDKEKETDKKKQNKKESLFF